MRRPSPGKAVFHVDGKLWFAKHFPSYNFDFAPVVLSKS